ncbi:MAG: tail fiber protein [Siphoviridae sp. ct7UA22]|nr:MAG: tail fiber protein [Siphoviridae sp. ct7UA22]
MIPTGEWSCRTAPLALSFNGLSVPSDRPAQPFDIKLGPQELSDAQGSLEEAVWMATFEDGAFYIRKADAGAWLARTFLFMTGEVPEELSLSFDSLGRAVVFYRLGGVCKLWYHNPALNARDFLLVTTEGTSVAAEFDNRGDTDDAMSDINLFYVVTDKLYSRLQRDNYAIVYDTGVAGPRLRIESVGRNVMNEVQVLYSFKDFRDGTLRLKKVLETNGSLLTNLKGNAFSVQFTVAKAPTKCTYKKLYDTLGQYVFCVVQHSGRFIDSDSEQERLFSLEHLPYFLGNPEGTNAHLTRLVVRSGPTRPDLYVNVDVNLDVFSAGTFLLRFTQATPEPGTGYPRKRIEFLKDGVTVVDVTVRDEDSMFLGGETADNALRFGAEFRGGGYMKYYPAVFTNISVSVNGVVMSWPKGYSDKNVDSIPSGNRLRLFQDGSPEKLFY